jgi:hypothetical protein
MAKSPGKRLDSWKEIAEYLGRDVRTALRWEKEKRLPVHRVPGGSRHAVYAYPEEIDRWLSGAMPETEGPPPELKPKPKVPLHRKQVSLGLVISGITILVTIIIVLGLNVRGSKPPRVERLLFLDKKLTALDKEGKISHTAEQCPERTHPKPILSWDPKNGWTELRPVSQKLP